jgi:trans-aconitate methyltransferase
MSVEGYFRERSEITRLVPFEARCVYDVGCGAGHIGAALKRERREIRVFGVEPDGAAAAEARQVLDEVFAGTADALDLERWPAPDCIIFADSLEHMNDPWATLARYAALLPRGGSAIVSLPNLLHHPAPFSLLKGRWDYSDAGILDRTHLRFFTRATAHELVEGAGLRITHVERTFSYPSDPLLRVLLKTLAAPQRWRESKRGVGRSGVSWLDVATMQYLFCAQKS